MPTIDELAPATAASDSDEFVVNQNSITRKITRAQVLAGVQTQLTIPGGTLIGRITSGSGSPETIAVGTYLTLAAGTLSAMAAPYSIALSPGGLVPSPGDLVPIGQGGSNVAVAYSVFLQGLASVGNVNGSRLQVTPTGTTIGMPLAELASSVIMTGGGSLQGPLVLASDPTAPLQAASKQYADLKVSRSGDSLTGSLLLASDPSAPLQAATKHYVDGGVGTALPLVGGTVTGQISLITPPTLPAHAVNKQYSDTQQSLLLPLSGGSLSGYLTLAAAPTAAFHAVTKQYVDANPGTDGVINVKLSPYNAKLDGVTDDTAAFVAAYQSAPAGGTIYVPNGIAVMQSASNWGVPLTKRLKWIVDGTTLSGGLPLADAIAAGAAGGAVILPATTTGFGTSGLVVSQSASQSTDFAVSHSSYVVSHAGGGTQSVISNSRTDTVISQSPSNNVWSGFDRLVWNGTATPSASSPARHVGRYIQTVRQTVGTSLNGSALPQPLMWATYVEFIDATGSPSSLTNASASMGMDWTGNGADDASQRQVLSLAIGQYNLSGTPVEVSTGIGVSLAPGSTGKIYKVLNVSVPYSVSVLDTTNATQLPGAAAIRLAAGQAVAFEPTNSVNLSYAPSTGAIVAQYGPMTCAIGRGISVGSGVVFGSNSVLPANSAGSIIWLVGAGTYTIALPPAASVAAGTGFTFSALGAGTVAIAPASGDAIDLSPVVLRQYDRYHIVSDGSSLWRETFRSNSVSPRFAGPPVLPSYTVAALPPTPGAGGKAFATNGRKPGEAIGAGTGVEAFFDGSHWISVCSGLPVAA